MAELVRNQRPLLQGVVISTKMDKTIVVLVETHRKHAKYAKRVKYAKRYYVHDEKNEAKVNDVVTIMGTRPLSKTKRFMLVSIDKKALEEIKINNKELDAAEKMKDVKELEKEVTEKKVAEIEAELARLKEAKKEAEKQAAKANKQIDGNKEAK